MREGRSRVVLKFPLGICGIAILSTVIEETGEGHDEVIVMGGRVMIINMFWTCVI